MKHQQGQQFTENREELVEKYFSGMSVYAEGNMALVGLLSDVQEIVSRDGVDARTKEHYRQVLNDIKCVLIEDHKKIRAAGEGGESYGA